MNTPPFILTIESPVGPISLAESAGRLIAIGMGKTGRAPFQDSLSQKDDPPEMRETPLLRRARKQINEYFSCRRRSFSLALRLKGTVFQKRVWETLLQIPYGETWSYRDVAEAVGCPRGARAVGQAVGANRLPLVIPCHRVIASNGKLGGFGCGLDVKRFLLKLEREGCWK